VNVFGICVTIHAVWQNQDPVTHISVPHVAVSVRGKWKTEIRVCPFQSTATEINIFNNFTIQSILQYSIDWDSVSSITCCTGNYIYERREQHNSTGNSVQWLIVPKSCAYHYVFLCVCNAFIIGYLMAYLCK